MCSQAVGEHLGQPRWVRSAGQQTADITAKDGLGDLNEGLLLGAASKQGERPEWARTRTVIVAGSGTAAFGIRISEADIQRDWRKLST
jgi:hypothetical protein